MWWQKLAGSKRKQNGVHQLIPGQKLHLQSAAFSLFICGLFIPGKPGHRESGLNNEWRLSQWRHLVVEKLTTGDIPELELNIAAKSGLDICLFLKKSKSQRDPCCCPCFLDIIPRSGVNYFPGLACESLGWIAGWLFRVQRRSGAETSGGHLLPWFGYFIV